MTDFYPRPPRGGRRFFLRASYLDLRFLSTPSARRATDLYRFIADFCVFLSTPSARRATRLRAVNKSGDPSFLSTPSARRATILCARPSRSFFDFYPRPPRGGRLVDLLAGHALRQFLSTPSARRATGRPVLRWYEKRISIHALREEGDTLTYDTDAITVDFYPRPPRGGRPSCDVVDAGPQLISIHALREEGDSTVARMLAIGGNFYPRPPRGGRRRSRSPVWSTLNFYPRPPRGGRPISACRSAYIAIFLSTPSARRATRRQPINETHIPISIHALREEGDGGSGLSKYGCRYFYPRPPRGGRPRNGF